MSALDRAPTLAEIGEALYGDRWQRAMARALAVSERTVRYWAAHAHPVPQRAWDDLCRLMLARRDELRHLIEHIPA